jgi:hypothetical protein
VRIAETNRCLSCPRLKSLASKIDVGWAGVCDVPPPATVQ